MAKRIRKEKKVVTTEVTDTAQVTEFDKYLGRIYDVNEAGNILREFVTSKEMRSRQFNVERIANTYIVYQVSRQNIVCYLKDNGIAIKRLEFKVLMESYGNDDIKWLLEKCVI